MFKKKLKWLRNNKIEVCIFLLILALASYFRFYKVPEAFYFISDAGRDAQAAFKILVDHKLALVGPRASVAGFFLGPFYFYLITLPLLIFNFDPIGLAYFSALVGVVAVCLIYLLSRQLFNPFAALAVSFLFAVSQIVIGHTRMAWNPTPLPVFTLLLMLTLGAYFRRKNIKWFLLTWVILGLGVQLHYNFIYFVPPVVLFFFFVTRDWKLWIREGLVGLLVFLALNLPLILFDVRHGFLTSKAFWVFVTSGGEDVSLSTGGIIFGLWQHLVSLLDLTFFPGILREIKIWVFGGIAILILQKQAKKSLSRFIIFIFISSVILFSFFRGTIQLYYYNFLLPFPFLILGYMIFVLSNKLWGKLLILVFLGFYFYFNWNLNVNPARPLRTLSQIKDVTASIVARVPVGATFNIASFTEEPWYTAEEYRYFSYVFGNRAQSAENYKNVEKLYVISSRPMDNPLSIQSRETAEFGAKKIEDSWQIGSAYVFQLSR